MLFDPFAYICMYLLRPDRTTQGIFTIQAASFSEGIMSSFEPTSHLKQVNDITIKSSSHCTQYLYFQICIKNLFFMILYTYICQDRDLSLTFLFLAEKIYTFLSIKYGIFYALCIIWICTCSLVVLPLDTRTTWKPVRPNTGNTSNPITIISINLCHQSRNSQYMHMIYSIYTS